MTIILSNCSKETASVTGIYKSNMDIGDKIAAGIRGRGWINGTTLELSSDSTFLLINCSTETLGKWSKRNDSLILVDNTKKFRIDSLNHTHWKDSLRLTTTAFGIRGNSLKTLYKSTSGQITIESLERTAVKK